jgi:L-fuconolactonase
MKIDAHQHFWNPARGDYGWMAGAGFEHLRRPILPVDFEPHRKAFGVDKTVLVQAAPTVNETEYLLGLADATDFVAKVVGWIDFENRDDLRHLQRLANHPKFSGVRPMIQDLTDPEWMHRRDVQWAFDTIIDLDLSFDALGFPLHIEPFQRLFDRYPQMRVVIDHCMKPKIREGEFEFWAEGMAKLAISTNAYCKLSGLATEASAGWTFGTLMPYVEYVLKCFGANRVMWGSDWPVLELNGAYNTWHDAAVALVSVSDRLAVFGGTAQSFYRLTPPNLPSAI